MIVLLAVMFGVVLLPPEQAEAAQAKYAALSGSNIYKVGKHRYKVNIKERGTAVRSPSAVLYRKKKGKWKKLLTHKNTYGMTVKAEYGKWLYYSVYPYGNGQDLYRYHLKTKKKYLVRKNVRHMLISGGKLYTNGFATDVSTVPIYVSRTNGKKAKCITKKANQARMKIYGKRIYYLECTYNKSHNKSTDRLVSRDLKGKRRRVLSKKIKSPASVLYFSNKSLIYAKPVKSTMRYYKINVKTKKQKRIYPSAKKVDNWIRTFY
ncbi:hypothetical protein [Anaerostipes sp.]|uniref:hypothetical protein n=1 Tax=Anaerostipes sp. TaxID=1872530 RepID=UPI0025C6E48E|nr:hypothetical protein [Anaerostipes sp.]